MSVGRYKENVEETMVSAIRTAVFKRDNYTCVYCGKRLSRRSTATQENRPTADHIIPKSQGGDSTEENLVTACRKCNLEKADTEIRICKCCGKKIKDGRFFADGKECFCDSCCSEIYEDFSVKPWERL